MKIQHISTHRMFHSNAKLMMSDWKTGEIFNPMCYHRSAIAKIERSGIKDRIAKAILEDNTDIYRGNPRAI